MSRKALEGNGHDRKDHFGRRAGVRRTGRRRRSTLCGTAGTDSGQPHRGKLKHSRPLEEWLGWARGLLELRLASARVGRETLDWLCVSVSILLSPVLSPLL